MTKRNKGLLIAGAAAALFLTGAVDARAEDKAGGAEVYCKGINGCKGKSVCATDKHACNGQNACKGQGIIKSSEAECSEKSGTVVPAP